MGWVSTGCVAPRCGKRRGVRSILQSLGLILACSLGAIAGSTDGENLAILIGINQYRSSEVPPLRGALNDIEAMRSVLETRFGFSTDAIRVLADSAASRTGILAALQELGSRARPEDVVYIHFSGHGSQVRDLDGDEEDGLDETIVPWDGRTAGVADVTDDEIGRLLSVIASRRKVVVLDSCHSGTGTRSLIVRTRSVPPDTRIDLYRAGVGTRAIVRADTQDYILMTGASANESALDGPVDGVYRGFFSYALSHVLGLGRNDVSPRSIHQDVQRTFSRIQDNLGSIQVPDPQLEGPEESLDRPLFDLRIGDPGGGTPPGFVLVESIGGSRIQLQNAGRLGGALGSIWAVYPPGEGAFVQGHAIATATVIEVRGGDAIGTTAFPAPTIDRGSRAVLVSGAAPTTKMLVELRIPEPARSRIAAWLHDRGAPVEITTETGSAPYIAELQGDDNRMEVVLYGAGGLQEIGRFAWKDQEEVARQLRTAFSRSARAAALKSLANPSSRMRLQASLVGGSDRAPDRFIRAEGAPRSAATSLAVDVSSDSECYLTIIDVDTQGGVTVLFPNPAQAPDFLPDGRLQAGSAVRIPDSFDSPNRSGFHWDFTPPAGIDTIVLLVASDPETARHVRVAMQEYEFICRQESVDPGIRSRSLAASPLDDLRNGLAALATARGVSVVSSVPLTTAKPPDQGSDWTSTSLTVFVKEPVSDRDPRY